VGLGAVAFPIPKEQTREISSISNGDELDQYQLEIDDGAPVGRYYDDYFIFAQSFIPTKSILTRVELMVFRNSTTTYDYVLSIREDLNGADLTSVSVAADEFLRSLHAVMSKTLPAYP